jgi:hypothetical protein
MTDESKDNCAGCTQKDECKAAWQRLGSSSIPSVWAKVLVAFVLPLAALVVALVLTERLARGRLASEAAVTAVSLAGAVMAALAVMLLGRMILMRFSKTTGSLKGQG